MAIRKGFYEICGIHPDGSSESFFYLSVERIKEIQRKGPAWKFENARLLEEALKSPNTIFEGLKREGMNEAFCYVAKPSSRYRKGGSIETPFSPNRVFVIYVDPMLDGNGYEILDWGIRVEDNANPGHPEEWQSDFERKTWPPV
jgi:hypothetical protein